VAALNGQAVAAATLPLLWHFRWLASGGGKRTIGNGGTGSRMMGLSSLRRCESGGFHPCRFFYTRAPRR
jgi:hypothetical protein